MKRILFVLVFVFALANVAWAAIPAGVDQDDEVVVTCHLDEYKLIDYVGTGFTITPTADEIEATEAVESVTGHQIDTWTNKGSGATVTLSEAWSNGSPAWSLFVTITGEGEKDCASGTFSVTGKETHLVTQYRLDDLSWADAPGEYTCTVEYTIS